MHRDVKEPVQGRTVVQNLKATWLELGVKNKKLSQNKLVDRFIILKPDDLGHIRREAY